MATESQMLSKTFTETVDDVLLAFTYDFTKNVDIWSDLTIEVDDKGTCTEFYAHRFILSQRSPAFRSMIAATPGGKDKISIIGHSPQSVIKLLEFLYTGNVSIHVPLSNRKGALGEAWELYRLAEQFEIESLSTFCETVMRTSIGKPSDQKKTQENNFDESTFNEIGISNRPSLSVASPSDSEAEACRDATNAAARALIAADLNAFLGRNPDGSFIGWIASLHPENVHLDSRMWIEGNDWMTVWKDAVVNGLAKEKKVKAVGVDMLSWANDDSDSLLLSNQNTLSNDTIDNLTTTSVDEERICLINEEDDMNATSVETGDNEKLSSLEESIKEETVEENSHRKSSTSSWTSWFTSKVSNNSTTEQQEKKEALTAEGSLMMMMKSQDPSTMNEPLSPSSRRAQDCIDDALDPKVEEALESYTAAISDHNELAAQAQAATSKESQRRQVIETAVLDVLSELKRLKPALSPLDDAKIHLRTVLEELDHFNVSPSQNASSAANSAANSTSTTPTSSSDTSFFAKQELQPNRSINVCIDDIPVEASTAPSSSTWMHYDMLSLGDIDNNDHNNRTLMKVHHTEGSEIILQGDDDLGTQNLAIKPDLSRSASSDAVKAALKLAEEAEWKQQVDEEKSSSTTPSPRAAGRTSATLPSKSSKQQIKKTDSFNEPVRSKGDVETEAAMAMETVRVLTEELYEEMLRHHDLEVSLETLERERIRLLVNAETRSREVMHSKEFLASRFVLVELRSKQAQQASVASPAIASSPEMKVSQTTYQVELEENGDKDDGEVQNDCDTETSLAILTKRLNRLEEKYKKEDKRLTSLGVRLKHHQGVSNIDGTNTTKEELVVVDEEEEKRVVSNWWMTRSAADSALGRNGAPRNDERAVELLTRAAQANCVHAQVILGIRHELGCGVPQDTKAAAQWYSLACGDLEKEDSGDTVAMMRMAELLSRCLHSGTSTEGSGLVDDVLKSESFARLGQEITKLDSIESGVSNEHTRKALLTAKLWCIVAGRGHPEALYRLAMLYESGLWGFSDRDLATVVPPPPAAHQISSAVQDEMMAVELYARSADYGHARASKRLASIYKHGLGTIVPDNVLEARYTDMVSDHVMKNKTLGPKASSFSSLLSSSSPSSISSSPSSSFTESKPISSSPAAVSSSNESSSSFQAPIFRISKSLSRITLNDSDSNKKSISQNLILNKKQSNDDNIDNIDDDGEEDDDNWQLAAAMANAITDAKPLKEKEEENTVSTGSYLTSFWSRSAKKVVKPSPDIEVTPPPPHPLTSLPLTTSPMPKSTSSTGQPGNEDTGIVETEASSADESRESIRLAKDGFTSSPDSSEGRKAAKVIQKALTTPKKGPWTAKKFMCAE